MEAKLAKPGQGIGRDIGRSEAVEGDLDRLIERRHDQRVTVEGERPAEEAWQESERRQEACGREENWASWCEYHQEQAERHRAVERRQDRCYYEPQLRGG